MASMAGIARIYRALKRNYYSEKLESLMRQIGGNGGEIIIKAKCLAFMSIPKHATKSPFSYTLAMLMMAQF